MVPVIYLDWIGAGSDLRSTPANANCFGAPGSPMQIQLEIAYLCNRLNLQRLRHACVTPAKHMHPLRHCRQGVLSNTCSTHAQITQESRLLQAHVNPLRC
jgi:hypothetical protein